MKMKMATHLPSQFFVVLVLLSCVVVVVSAASYNINSFPMILSNAQRNGLVANTTALDRASVDVVWTFLEPDGDEFRDAPIFSYDDNAVYSAAYTGFIYGIDATSGAQIWESCVGTPPPFPSDPCSDSGIGDPFDFPYGQLTLLSDGNLIILRAAEGKKPEQLICLNKTTGAIIWSYAPPASNFLSIPSVVPEDGGDAILVWIASYTHLFYAILNGTTGEEVNVVSYPDRDADAIIAAMAIDPADGNVITQYWDSGKGCRGGIYACIGIGKFDVFTGALIWNATMEESFTNGMVAIAPAQNAVYATSSQLSAYAYNLETGAGIFKADAVYSSFDMGYASVCADGTIIIVDTTGSILGYSPTPERVMTPIWVTTTSLVSSIAVTTLADNTFVHSVGNGVYARHCTNSSVIWKQNFGNAEAGGYIVAASTDSVFANVYWTGKEVGMIVKITNGQGNTTSAFYE